jgi:hypothetical protein
VLAQVFAVLGLNASIDAPLLDYHYAASGLQRHDPMAMKNVVCMA